MSLASLKRLAEVANLESGWQHIGAEHRAELVAVLAGRAAEWTAFVGTVRALEPTLEAARAALRADARRLGKTKREREAALDRLGAVMERAVRASVHLVPSGSGVHLGDGLILTCAHCVDHDDDDDDDDGDGDGDAEPRVRDFTGGSCRPPTRAEKVRFDEARAAWRARRAARPSSRRPSRRVGRVKHCVAVGGAHQPCVCVAADEASDLALLRLAEPQRLPGLGRLALGAEGSDAVGAAVLAVGNPYDWDLEAPDGAKPRRNGFAPFWASAGRIQGELDAAVASQKGVGPQRHSCWTCEPFSPLLLFRRRNL